jgi:hypothetical protein
MSENKTAEGETVCLNDWLCELVERLKLTKDEVAFRKREASRNNDYLKAHCASIIEEMYGSFIDDLEDRPNT